MKRLYASLIIVLIVAIVAVISVDAALSTRSAQRASRHPSLNHAWRTRMRAHQKVQHKLSHHLRARTKVGYTWDTETYVQPLDHFSFDSEVTFSQRYLINTDSWLTPEEGGPGPIFFYTGNEGGIEDFAANTGFMWENAPEFNAMVVFAEHRYYGNSLPYDDDTPRDLLYYEHLTTAQTLADFASLISYIKSKYNAEDSKVILFGGSYGAMLSTWFRMHYPQLSVGAIASSAPMLLFPSLDLVSPSAFNEKVTADYELTSSVCVEQIRSVWDIMANLATTQAGRDSIAEAFGLCFTLDAEWEVTEYLFYEVQAALVYMAMIDYPYATDFMAPLPGSPVSVACEMFSADRSSDLEIIASLGAATGVWYNTTGEAGDCYDFDSVGDLDDQDDDYAWDYQSCTELVLPSASTGIADMFWSDPWDFDDFVTDCQSWFPSVTVSVSNSDTAETQTKTLTIEPSKDFITTFYAGPVSDYASFSNIVFTNGGLDPWGVAGLPTTLGSINPTMTSIMEADAAHHLDLRASNADYDPSAVVAARIMLRQQIHDWIGDGIVLTETSDSSSDSDSASDATSATTIEAATTTTATIPATSTRPDAPPEVDGAAPIAPAPKVVKSKKAVHSSSKHSAAARAAAHPAKIALKTSTSTSTSTSTRHATVPRPQVKKTAAHTSSTSSSKKSSSLRRRVFNKH